MTITCPVCGLTSHHPDDVKHGYCGNCHWWTSDPILAPFTLAVVYDKTDGTTTTERD